MVFCFVLKAIFFFFGWIGEEAGEGVKELCSSCVFSRAYLKKKMWGKPGAKQLILPKFFFQMGVFDN